MCNVVIINIEFNRITVMIMHRTFNRLLWTDVDYNDDYVVDDFGNMVVTCDYKVLYYAGFLVFNVIKAEQ